jgi:SAM-dependent methyltransferase
MPYRSLFNAVEYAGADTHQHGHLPIHIIESDFVFPFEKEYFDVCLCFQVLEHVREVGFFHDEIQRCLKNNGVVYLTTHGIFRVHAEEDYYRWTSQGLRKHFAEHGWSDVRIIPVDNSIVSISSLMNDAIETLIGPDRNTLLKRLRWVGLKAIIMSVNVLASLSLALLPTKVLQKLTPNSSNFLVVAKAKK